MRKYTLMVLCSLFGLNLCVLASDDATSEQRWLNYNVIPISVSKACDQYDESFWIPFTPWPTTMSYFSYTVKNCLIPTTFGESIGYKPKYESERVSYLYNLGKDGKCELARQDLADTIALQSSDPCSNKP